MAEDCDHGWCHTTRCRSEYKKKKMAEYRSDPEKYARELQRQTARRRANWKKAVERLGGRCVDCGATENLSFDHVRGEKLFEIGSRLTRNWSGIVDEVDKCELRCLSCHGKKDGKKAWSKKKAA